MTVYPDRNLRGANSLKAYGAAVWDKPCASAE